jgi:seryl-tRNA synthetase
MTLLTILLDVQEAGGTGDVALITALISGGGVVGGFVKMVQDKATMKQEIKGLKEKILEVSASKKAMKKDITGQMEKNEQVLHQRIDRVRDDNIKSYDKLEAKIVEVEKKIDDHTKQIIEAIQRK